MPPIQDIPTSLKLHLGIRSGVFSNGWDLGLPVLAGVAVEGLFPTALHRSETRNPANRPSSAFTLFTAENFLLGIAQVPILDDLAEHTKTLYRDLLMQLGSNTLCRIWNYVPAINDSRAGGLENYRAFCRGRALAFESMLGRDFEPRLCAASAVGTDSNLLTVAFAAHQSSSTAFENPLQVPAYSYPELYGPRPPSFARASIVPQPHGRRHAFISGTAAIRGHHSVGPGDTATQLSCTIENLAAIGSRCGIGSDLAAGRCASRWFKIYLRHPADLDQTRDLLTRTVLHPDDHVCYLRSDICRAELNVEIEVSALDVQG